MPDKHLATAEGTVEGEAAAEDAAEAVHDWLSAARHINSCGATS